MQNGKMINHPQIDAMIKTYLKLRKRIDENTEQIKHDKALQDQLASAMVGFLDETGMEGARTQYGTIFTKTTPYASLSDPDAFMSHVIGNGAFELLSRHANATACVEYTKEHGELPPGVKLNMIRKLNVRAAGEPV